MKKAPAIAGTFWWGKVDSNHRSRRQQIYSLPHLTALEFPHIEIWSWWTDSNPRPADYKSAALPAELHQQFQQQDLSYQISACLSTEKFFAFSTRFFILPAGHMRLAGICIQERSIAFGNKRTTPPPGGALRSSRAGLGIKRGSGTAAPAAAGGAGAPPVGGGGGGRAPPAGGGGARRRRHCARCGLLLRRARPPCGGGSASCGRRRGS